MKISEGLKTFLADNKVQSLINDSEWTQLFLMLYKNYSGLCTSYPDIDIDLILCLSHAGIVTQDTLIKTNFKAKQYINFEELKNFLL